VQLVNHRLREVQPAPIVSIAAQGRFRLEALLVHRVLLTLTVMYLDYRLLLVLVHVQLTQYLLLAVYLVLIVSASWIHLTLLMAQQVDYLAKLVALDVLQEGTAIQLELDVQSHPHRPQ
jgi:hypothetical protein